MDYTPDLDMTVVLAATEGAAREAGHVREAFVRGLMAGLVVMVDAVDDGRALGPAWCQLVRDLIALHEEHRI